MIITIAEEAGSTPSALSSKLSARRKNVIMSAAKSTP